jgi:hypothetical protein
LRDLKLAAALGLNVAAGHRPALRQISRNPAAQQHVQQESSSPFEIPLFTTHNLNHDNRTIPAKHKTKS